MTQIDDINDLDKGDEVLFADRVNPCTVTEEAGPPNEGNGFRSAKLNGPQGGYIVLAQEYDDTPYTMNRPYRELDDLRVVN